MIWPSKEELALATFRPPAGEAPPQESQGQEKAETGSLWAAEVSSPDKSLLSKKWLPGGHTTLPLSKLTPSATDNLEHYFQELILK